jgi:hypothetical protein
LAGFFAVFGFTHQCVSDEAISVPDSNNALRRFRRERDFFQSNPAGIAVFVNSFPILIGLCGFKLHGFIADAAIRRSPFADKSQECGQLGSLRKRIIGSHKKPGRKGS